MSSAQNNPEPTSWERLEEALQQAIDCPPDQVGAVLARISAEDAALGREVEKLLAASRRLSFLDAPALSAGSGSPGSARQVAGFEIEHELGRGGMGIVYYATRTTREPYEAAIKFLITTGEEPLAWESRFRREQEVLSRLDHPNIARLLDGGQSQGPFLVMEYIDGRRINRYCDHHQLSIEERLRLFLEVCNAVHYAHQNLVIHCDIKPANLLVDTHGVPKLLDFGVAKLLDGAGQPSAETTLTLPRPLTLDYASPEQIEGRTPTTASDIYSLGVVLYELLCGDVPYRLGLYAPQEIRALLEADDPTLPSAVVASTAIDTGAREPVRCGLSTAALSRCLEGELDLITTKALRFDPRHRYASAAELASDVRRYLEGLPIHARSESLRYTLQRLVRRHKLASAISILALTFIVAFGGAMAWQNLRIIRAQERAERALHASEAVSEFLVGLFEEAEEHALSNRQITAGELVDRGTERLGSAFEEQPMTRAAVESALGRIHLNLGRYPESRRRIESALAIQRSLGEVSQVAESLELLGRLHRREGRFDESRHALDEALSLHHAHPGTVGAHASALSELARLENALGNYEAAERLYVRSLELHGSGQRSLEVAGILHGLSSVYRDLGRYDEAEQLLEEVIEIQVERLGPNHLTVGATFNTLGRIYRSQGRYGQAEASLKQAVSIYDAILGPDHVATASPKTNLAIVYGSIGEYDRACELFEEILAIRRAAYLGRPHPHIGSSLLNLANATDLSGDRERAIELYREAHEAFSAVFDPDHETLGLTFYNLGTLYVVSGELDLAEEHLRRSLEIYRKKLGPDHDRFADGLASLGEIAHLRGDLESAEELLEAAVTIYEKASETHPNLSAALRRLGLIELDRENLVAARPWLARALEIRQQTLPRFHEVLLESQLDWADWLVASGREAEAEQLLRDLLAAAGEAETKVRSRSVFVAEIAAANLRLGRLLQEQGQMSEGRQRLETAAVQLRSIASRTVDAERDLALTLAALGEHRQASELASGLVERGIKDRRLEPVLAAVRID